MGGLEVKGRRLAYLKSTLYEMPNSPSSVQSVRLRGISAGSAPRRCLPTAALRASRLAPRKCLRAAKVTERSVNRPSSDDKRNIAKEQKREKWAGSRRRATDCQRRLKQHQRPSSVSLNISNAHISSTEKPVSVSKTATAAVDVNFAATLNFEPDGRSYIRGHNVKIEKVHEDFISSFKLKLREKGQTFVNQVKLTEKKL